MANVYWAARDLDGWAFVGNHQFIMIQLATSEKLMRTSSTVQSGMTFATLGGHNTNSNLVLIANQTADVESVKENYRGYSTNWADYDLEKHKITPPKGTGWSFAIEVEKLAYNYDTNTKSTPQSYGLLNYNCATWVNTLLKVAGVSQTERSRLGEFSGIDWGEEDLLDESLFK